jgi:hypothetical protein
MTAPKQDADRIGELEDSLKAAEMRVTEMRAERDEAHELVDRMREHLEDARAVMEQWKAAFDMTLGDDGRWSFQDGEGEVYFELLSEHRALLKDWNKYVAVYNANIAARSPGRPLNASDAQCAEVRQLRKRKLSLRDIADETSLALSTDRTIIGRDNRSDRTTIKRLQRFDPMNAAAIAAKARKRTRDALPAQINSSTADNESLQKEARGLGRGRS